METVVIKPGGDSKRAYRVWIGPSLIERAGDWGKSLAGGRAFLISDERLGAATSRWVGALSRAGWKVTATSVRVSEGAKDYRKLFPLYGRMIEAGMDRHSVIFALGGGVIGDLAGFIAATYLRGIRWVGIPTTLLAQVDSSVGGKTGVNHPLGKNLIGAFHQPSLVLCDTDVLKTLAQRDIVSGFAEMVKLGLTLDKEYFTFLSKHRDAILALKTPQVTKAIAEAVRIKGVIVAKDEYERLGHRQVLNFGHTLGHALESATQYRKFRHGEAVLWGMRLETALSVVRGTLSQSRALEIDAFLKALKVPALPKTCTVEHLSALIGRDKKVKNGKVTFILLKGIGRATTDNQISPSDLSAVWNQIGKGQR